MKRKLKVLVAAKPWHGGLYQYYFNAFKRRDDVEAQLYFTYPNTFSDYVSYQINKQDWLNNQIKKINAFKYDLGFFINTFPKIEELENTNNVLYLTDEASIKQNMLDSFSNVYLSDTGYAEKFINNKNYLGELPFAFDPYIHKSGALNNKRKLIQSIANIDDNRNKWFALMSKHKCFPNIHGNYFTKSNYLLSHPLKIHPSVNFNNQNKVYSNYLISLNIHSDVIKHGTNLKTFEACGFRVPQIINYVKGLDNFFEPNKEIMIFSNIQEYKEKLDLLKKDKRLRNTLIKNSFKRAMANHKYDDRVKLIIDNFKATGVRKENTLDKKSSLIVPAKKFGQD